jgi:hypothetical protein
VRLRAHRGHRRDATGRGRHEIESAPSKRFALVAGLIMRLFLLRSSLPQRHRTHTLTRCSSQVRAMCVCWVGSTSPTTVLTAVAMAGQGGCGDRC